jgi:citrate lyase subunit beta/citryl-CoA lyase
MTVTAESFAHARSLLVVPGHRPDRFAKAVASGADAVMLDLEDAVCTKYKVEARGNIDRWLAGGSTGIVRVNGIGTLWHEEDVAMLAGRRCAVMLPKTTDPDEVAGITARLGAGSWVVPAIETAAGVLAAHRICAAPEVSRIVFGNADLATDLGVDLADREALAHARCQLVLVSAAAGIAPPMDGVTAAVTDIELLTADARHALALGFSGKACLHPRQVAVVNTVFSPTADELDWARGVLAAAGDGSVSLHDDQVIGKPVIDRARLLLARFQA